MFLWIPAREAWRDGVKLGFFPAAILNAPVRILRGTKRGHWADLPDLDGDFRFRNLPESDHGALARGDLARQLGFRLKEDAPSGAFRTGPFLWNLFGVERRVAAEKATPEGTVLLRFAAAEQGIALIQEILRIENAGELRYCRTEKHFWLRADSLSRFTTLAIEQGEYPQATLFTERAPNLWIQSGWTHPLEEVMAFPTAVLTLIDQGNDIAFLEENDFHPLFTAAQWKIEPPKERAAKSGKGEPFLEIPLKLVELPPSKDNAVPDLWVAGAADLPQLCRWMEEASLEVRQAFRFAALAGDAGGADETILLYRFREVLLSALGEMPGKSYRQSRQLTGLFLPRGMQIHPDPGPVYLRRLVGMERLDHMAWIERRPDGRLLPQVFPASALGGWETIIRFSLEKTQSTWRVWTQSFSFAWETIPEAKDPVVILSSPQHPEENQPEAERPQNNPNQSGPSSPGNREKPSKNRKVKGETKAAQVSVDLFAKVEARFSPSPQGDGENRASKKLLEDFDASSLAWGDPGRVDQLRALALAWQAEGQPIWAGKACLIAAWNQGRTPWDDDTGHAQLRAWHRAEAQLRGLPTEPDFSTLASQASSPEFRLNQMGWLLTGLILRAGTKSKESGGLAQEEYRALQAVLIEHGPAASQRLLFDAWNQLAVLQSDRLIATRGAERQRFSLLEMGLNLKEEWPGPLLGRRSGAGEARNQLEALGALLVQTTGWLEQHGQNDSRCMTLALVRWSFAYGLARLGAGEKARELAGLASQRMATGELAPLVAEAYRFRVEQALSGKPASGPLPAEWQKRVSQLEGLKAFPLDYTREMSQILEPHQSVQPFASALGIGQDSWAANLAAHGGDPAGLGRICLERAEGLRLVEPAKAVAGWVELLDRILLVPSADARAILDILWDWRPPPVSSGNHDGKSPKSASRRTSPPIDLRIAVRMLIAGSFFQHRAGDNFEAILPLLEDRERLAGWMGVLRVAAATGAVVPQKTLGMNKELYLFCSRRLGLLAQMDRKSWMAPILDALARGLEKLGQVQHASHGRFLVDAARLRFLPTEDDAGIWQRLERELRAESQQLAANGMRRNEPWQAYVNKLVAYIQAAGARGPAWATEKLQALFEWIVPLSDYFATNPALAVRGSEAHRAGLFAYERNQVEWIEAMVLAIAESAEATVSEWARRDEALVRARITASLDAGHHEGNRPIHWERELSL